MGFVGKDAAMSNRRIRRDQYVQTEGQDNRFADALKRRIAELT